MLQLQPVGVLHVPQQEHVGIRNQLHFVLARILSHSLEAVFVIFTAGTDKSLLYLIVDLALKRGWDWALRTFFALRGADDIGCSAEGCIRENSEGRQRCPGDLVTSAKVPSSTPVSKHLSGNRLAIVKLATACQSLSKALKA